MLLCEEILQHLELQLSLHPLDSAIVFWADLEGPQIYHLSFCGRSQNHKRDHERDLELISGSNFWCNLDYF